MNQFSLITPIHDLNNLFVKSINAYKSIADNDNIHSVKKNNFTQKGDCEKKVKNKKKEQSTQFFICKCLVLIYTMTRIATQ